MQWEQSAAMLNLLPSLRLLGEASRSLPPDPTGVRPPAENGHDPWGPGHSHLQLSTWMGHMTLVSRNGDLCFSCAREATCSTSSVKEI